MKKTFAVFLFLIALIATPSFAAKISIIASVGDDAITSQDLINRTRFAILTSGLKGDDETAKKLAPQILQTMINEQLQIQEAQRLGLKIDNEDLEKAVLSVEEKNKMPPGTMKDILGKAGIPYSTFQQQVKSQIAWAQIKNKAINPRVIISDDEVDDFLKAQSMNLTQEEYHIQEIVLPVENPEDDPKVLETAKKLASELKGGKDFATVAKQFSQSASSLNGGDIGWLAENNIPKELLGEIKRSGVGTISNPVRSIEGYFILKVLESRTVNSNEDESLVTLRQFDLPAGGNIANKIAQTRKLKDAGKGCLASDKYARDNGFSLTDYGTVKIKETDPRIIDVVTRLETGKFSTPLNMGKTISVLLVCEKIEDLTVKLDDGKRERARQLLRNRKVELDARKYLRDLRRSTNVEVKA